MKEVSIGRSWETRIRMSPYYLCNLKFKIISKKILNYSNDNKKKKATIKYTMREAKRHMANCRKGGLQFISQTKVKPP